MTYQGMELISMTEEAIPTAAIADRPERVEFRSFFQREYPRLVRALVATTGNVADAEEAVQEAMARTFERWGRVASRGAPTGYVYVTAVNAHRRSRRRLARLLFGRHEESASVGSDGVDDLVRRDLLLRGLASLPPGERDALLMVGWLGMDAAEVGEVLHIKPASVRSRVHRARQHLATIREEVTKDD